MMFPPAATWTRAVGLRGLYKAFLYSSRKNTLYFLFNSYIINRYILTYTYSR